MFFQPLHTEYLSSVPSISLFSDQLFTSNYFGRSTSCQQHTFTGYNQQFPLFLKILALCHYPLAYVQRIQSTIQHSLQASILASIEAVAQGTTNRSNCIQIIIAMISFDAGCCRFVYIRNTTIIVKVYYQNFEAIEQNTNT